ncbi:MAG: hypothetical protein H6553_04045 [Chitinophagales bacterium]|nr:hypothetical protein [Chitinophagales bacterium]
MKDYLRVHQEIIDLIEKIKIEFPELYDSINEMPIIDDLNNTDTLNTQQLEKYLHSLQNRYNAYKLSNGQ